jgi:DNA-directed RNA polymerase subunit RPC12/RpoP
MDWETFLENIGLWFNTFIEWFIEQPLYGQILVIIGIVALLALTVTLLYYIIKGVAYLVYYTIKGVFYLLKYIGYGFFKLCEGFYLLVSGKSKLKTENNNQNGINTKSSEEKHVFLEYCSECGKRSSIKMKNHLEVNEMVYCVNCGTRIEVKQSVQALTISH